MPCFPYPEENKRSFMRFLLLLAALPLLAAEWRVMTFNVRYPNPSGA